MQKVVLVAAGGMAGAVARYLLTCLAAGKFGMNFPYGTLLANVIGCFFAGVIMGAISEKALLGENARLLLVVGFTGGLTTFSSFSYETISFFQQQQYLLSCVNIFGNMFLGLCATVLGINLIRLL